MAVLKKVLAVTALVAASSTAFAQEQVEIRFSWWGGTARNEQTMEVIKAFEEKHPHIKVNPEMAAMGDIRTRLATQIPSGIEPDLMMLEGTWLESYSPNGDGFYDLSKLESIDFEDYNQAHIDFSTVNGKLHITPRAIGGRAFYYNQNLWDEAGLELPNTFAELYEAGKYFKENHYQEKYPLVLDMDMFMSFMILYMTQKYNEPFINEETMQVHYTQEQLEDMFSVYSTLVDNHITPSITVLNSYGQSGISTKGPWLEGNWGGAYVVPSLANDYLSYLPENYSLAIGPYLHLEDATQSAPLSQTGHGYSISKNTKHPEEAALFLDFMLNREPGVSIVGITRGIPVNQKAIETLLDKGIVSEDDLSYQGVQLLQGLTYETTISSYAEAERFMSDFQNTLEAMEYENLTPAEAASRFTRLANRSLRRLGRG